jgi:hypothetical protein
LLKTIAVNRVYRTAVLSAIFGCTSLSKIARIEAASFFADKAKKIQRKAGLPLIFSKGIALQNKLL